MPATAHIGFIVAAYGAGVMVIVALIAWVMLDYRIAAPHSRRTGNDRSLAALTATRVGG